MIETSTAEWHFCYNFDGVELTAGQLYEAERVIDVFRQELLNDPDDAIIEFHFGCNSDRIEWDDKDFSHMEIAPNFIVSLNFEELGAGRFNAITPEGIEGLLFRGRNKKQFEQELLTALVLERDRVAHGIDSELHLEGIQKHLRRARGAALTSFKAATANWK
ncbi:hypothetical protein [Agrobacterium sp. B1(2019)]|uniref:hypothetical protein n=1 Tax=Agrobacterium sp. B1(2019) TaxID=2607032 RepID=UPI0011ED42B4|nr:hypothetical protein [Agrobacterium sp. B1(2019)]TZG34279.1 hypothetical protein AGR1_16365 [Agrobacterium sp. B1(2019)]